MDSSFRQTADRVKGMRTIEDEIRATLKRRGLSIREKDFAWNRNRPYEAVPETLELSVRTNGARPALQTFTHDEVARCARAVRDPVVTAKIQAMIEHVQAPNGKQRDD
jgi:hypothetical protein